MPQLASAFNSSLSGSQSSFPLLGRCDRGTETSPTQEGNTQVVSLNWKADEHTHTLSIDCSAPVGSLCTYGITKRRCKHGSKRHYSSASFNEMEMTPPPPPTPPARRQAFHSETCSQHQQYEYAMVTPVSHVCLPGLLCIASCKVVCQQCDTDPSVF